MLCRLVSIRSMPGSRYRSVLSAVRESERIRLAGRPHFSEYAYRRSRELRQAIGELIRARINGDFVDAAELAEVLRDAGDTYGVGVDNAVAAYNDHVESYGHMISHCGDCHRLFPDYCMANTVSHGEVCETCLDDSFVHCEDGDGDAWYRHDTVFQHDNGAWYTYDEGEESESRHIKNYSENVLNYCRADDKVKSSCYGDFLMGIELEINAEYRRTAAEHIHDQLEDYAIMKHDGSLNDDKGIEIVTAPRGLAEHVKRLGEFDPGEGVTAWDAGCCGMHVHIDSRAFTALTLGKFIEFINARYNDKFIRNIAGRHPGTSPQASSYCQREGTLPVGNPKMILDGKANDRYYMVNTTTLDEAEAERLGVEYSDCKDFNTVELRIFRATLNKKRLLAQIEFAHAAVAFCRVASIRQLKQEDFLKWLRGVYGVYPNLAKWFGVKQQKAVLTTVPEPSEAEEI